MDRQVRIWGKEGQQKLGSQNVAVVGCGGTGAIACEQLARIGVYNFSLFDEDRVEDTNLNRLINAYPEHLDIMKTDVAAMAIKRINPSAVVQVNHEFISRKNLHKLAGHSIIVGAVDSEVCRLYLNDASLRYLIPYLDIGTGINIDSEGRITDLGGQVRFVNPGTTPCLRCYHNGIDALEVMLDLMGEEEHATRRQLGYVKGTDFSPAPAVLPLNSAVVSMAMLELASAVTGYGLIRSYVHYEALSNKVTVLDDEERMAPQSACPACGPGGILGLANMSHQRYVTQEEQEKLAAALAKPSKAQKTESMSDDPESVMTCGMNQYTNKLIGILTAAVGNVLMLALRKTRFIELSLQLLAARNRGSTDSLD